MFSDTRDEVEQILLELRLRCQKHISQVLVQADIHPGFTESGLYAAVGGGKMLRPLIALAVHNDLSGEREPSEHAIQQSISLELLHAASLVHDDLPALDNDSERRGKATVHVKFGDGVAILTGDLLVGLAFAQASREKQPGVDAVLEILQTLSTAWTALCDGQYRDIMREADIRLINVRKTGALFSAALVIGSLTAGNCSTFTKAILSDLGQSFGLLFQSLDDIADNSSVLDKKERYRATSIESEVGKVFRNTLERYKKHVFSLTGDNNRILMLEVCLDLACRSFEL